MTITRTQVSSISYEGNGATSFSFPFKVQQNTEIKVDFYDSNNSVQTLTLDTDYTVSNWDIEGQGMISLTNALQTGTKITIQPNVNFTQLVDLKNQQTLSPETVENTLDKLTLLTRQNNELLSRALIFRNNLSDKNVEITESLVAGYGFEVNSTGDGIKLTELPIANIISTATTLKNTTETYKDSALSSLNSIQKLILGSKSSAPTVDNNGNALVTGTLYYDTTATLAKIYNGTAWQDVAGLVTSASNLTTGTLPIARLADGSIITVKLADDSVTQDKIANNSVGTDELINNSVTTGKIADDSVTKAKLEQGSYLPTHIYTDTTGKFFTRNTDGSLPTGIDSTKVWSLTDQADGGIMPSGKNHIELPLKVSGTLGGGGGGGSGGYGSSDAGSDGGDTVFLGITAQGGRGGRPKGGTGYSHLTDTLVNNSTIISFSLNNRGGSSNNSSADYADSQGVFGYPGGQVFFIATLTPNTVYDYVVGGGGSGGSGDQGGGASGENGFITVNH